MKKTTSLFMVFVLGFCIKTIAQTYEFPFQNPELSIEERAKDLVSRLTLEEKIAQLLHNTPAVERLGIPAYSWWNEALHGIAQSGRATVFPQAIGMAATWDTDLIQQVGDAISTEGRAKYNIFSKKGIRIWYSGLTYWSPNINIFRDPRWGRGQETYGEDPFLTARMGVSFVKGLQGNHPKYLKSAALAKHYAVHNGPEGLRHEFDAVVSQKDLWETYLPAFEALVKEANVEGVMGAYNRTNGKPATAHPYLMQDVLRGQWGFDGYFVSDCWAVRDFYKDGHNFLPDKKSAAALALNEGCNLNCGDSYEDLLLAIEAGLTSEAEVDKNLLQLIKTRFKLGMFDPMGSTPFDNLGEESIATEKHLALSKEVATKSMVLLKNKDNILPLKGINSMYITGPTLFNGEVMVGNYQGVSDNVVTFYEGLMKKAGKTVYVKHETAALVDRANPNPIDWFSDKGELMDVTIACVGINSLVEGEEGSAIASELRGDRDGIGLPDYQVEYLRKIRAKSEKLVIVVSGGSAMAMPEVYEMADALIFTWYPGEQGGDALADLLFGDAVPSGKLPVTFVKSIEDLPPFEDYAMKGRTYRYQKSEPLFPFGFGLSYTTFEYGDLELSEAKIKKGKSVTVTGTIKNTGAYDADEVVQFYISDVEASVDVPLQSLKGFQRISLKAGESKAFTFTITPKMMEMVDNEGKSLIEKGEFKVTVGGCSPSTVNEKLGASKGVSAIFKVN